MSDAYIAFFDVKWSVCSAFRTSYDCR